MVTRVFSLNGIIKTAYDSLKRLQNLDNVQIVFWN